jgi:flagellar biosynthesis/type III secretory pathway protein FliH
MRENGSFVPLAFFLRPARPEPPQIVDDVRIEPAAAAEIVETLAAARRFHAGLRDAFDVALAELLSRIADDVLGRELKLSGPDIAAIAGAALERFGRRNVLSVRANPRDAEALQDFELEVIADPAIHRGDIVLELRSGTIDLSLSARLQVALSSGISCAT